ncbi:sigma-70 family RNA polymerase sigma factor [Paenibacillus sp. HB172176]|uniref:RNA polymerase sigma factor n=1 Tax=Paenibacillus sp. HB172176 TaxID=2493690 RepID=UPI00143B4BD8|nr:sigma-70 family RNA polymerase sigma factor [Paenibacillus sp. HB172176]
MSEEGQMIQMLRRGDHLALEGLMNRFGTDVLRTAALLLKDRHLAEDVSQEAFLQAFQRISQFRGEGTLRGWLLQITVNLCRARMRRASWRRLLFPGERGGADKTAGSAEQPILSAELAEPGSTRHMDGMTLRQEVESLPRKYREVVVLYYFQELTVKEIVVVLGEAEGTIKSKLSRARGLLKQQLEEGGWEHGQSLG